MKNYRLTIRFDGTRFAGWEHQPDQDTVQGRIEKVLARMLEFPEDQIPDVIGCGRTDAGVHARALIANVKMDTPMTPEEIRDYCNRYLPDDISIDRVDLAGDRFHARYNAIGKTYQYTCYYDPEAKPVFDRKYVTVLDTMPDLERMRQAAEILQGTHDFRSFCAAAGKKKSTVRDVDSICIEQDGPYIRLRYHGNGFLQNMVRILTGTLLEVGYGKRDARSMQELLELRDRRKAGYTAPAQGLCLMQVDYM